MRGKEMHFAGTKSVLVLLCPFPGSVQMRSNLKETNSLSLKANTSI